MNFFNLHNHTEFSFLDGYGTPAQVSDRLKEIGQDGIALTDHGSIYSHAPFAKFFKKSEQHLVFGCEMYVVSELKHERGYNHLTVLVKTQEGYQNLLWLVNQSYTEEQFYYKPRITVDQLVEHSKGLIILSGCMCDGLFVKNKASDQDQFFQQVIKFFKDIEWYVELQPFKDEQPKWDAIITLAHKYKLPMVVTGDCHYPKESYKPVHDFMLAINMNKPMSDPDRLKMDYPLHIPSAQEMYLRIAAMGANDKFAVETMQRCYDIAHSCKIELPKTSLVTTGKTFDDLRKMAHKGLKKRGLVSPDYKKRLDYELDLIKTKNFMDYFIIISDLMQWAKKNMLCGAGRGSSAGSLVCYCLEITEVDPIKHNLLFERFIDINRVDLPDIDLDFPSDRREEVIAYLANKYGKENTTQLINFNTYKPKAIIQDAARVLKIPIWEVKEGGSQIIDRSGGDARANFCLRDSIEQFDKLKMLFTKYPKLYDAIDLEGQVRGVGKHAAAVVIAKDPLNTVGVVNNDGNFCIDKYNVEAHGLLKIDVLGIETLSILTDVCNEVGFPWHDLYTLPLDDALTFEKVFTPSKLYGIFQFEGMAVQQTCKQIKPTTFEQLNHITALGRPGALNSYTTAEYVKRFTGSHGKYDYSKRKDVVDQFSVSDPALNPYTSDTLGLILFQEQVMQVVKEIGKFGWASTSAVRIAMSKSLGEEHFNKYKADFIKGAAEDGINQERAERIWKQVYTFGSWGFNRSHSISYSYLSYWCGYMKAHYPAQYYARILKDKTEEADIKPILKEWGGSFLPLDINKSKMYFSTDGTQLIGGFTNVNGIGAKHAEKIIAQQPFESMDDFASRIPKGMAAKIMDALNGSLEWAVIQTLEEQYKDELAALALTSPLTTCTALMKSKMPAGIVLAKVVGVNLRNSNDPDKIAKRNGKVMKGYPEYVILKVKDDDEEIWHVYCDHKITERLKQDLLSLNGKVCLFKFKIKGMAGGSSQGGIPTLEKYKIMGGTR